ncbi:hypothetical protein CTI12_AA252910 [Artemisia annua]|uniref:Uncharacterized protein n=1 Tax=Artemisia annua TaxID=35608 RepID=A0A2U1NLH6_ARTAN|nr:hypothetical protein CTI12_AA252910 [Artemisia annua]
MDSTGQPSSVSSPLLTQQEDHFVASINEEHETTCWGCGLRLIIAPYAPVFRCGWCGAITNHNARKSDGKYSWLRRLRDRCFVTILLLFMLFIIGITSNLKSYSFSVHINISLRHNMFNVFNELTVGCLGYLPCSYFSE